MIGLPPELTEASALVIAAALEGDETAVYHVLYGLPPEDTPTVCQAAVVALAQLLGEFLPADAIQTAIREARTVARTATEGNRP